MTSKGGTDSAKLVELRISTKRMATCRSSPTDPWVVVSFLWSASPASFASSMSRLIVTSPTIAVWHARRTLSPKCSCAASACSFSLRAQQNSKPLRTSTRHVEHRAFPRHSFVRGIPARKDAERTLSKLEASTYRWSGKNKMRGTALAKLQCSFPSSEKHRKSRWMYRLSTT